MKLHNKSFLSKLGLFLAVLFLIPYVVSFASPYWLSAEFQLQIPYNGKLLPLNVKSHMGLLQSCKETTDSASNTTTDCGSDGASDWQWAAAAFGIAGLALAVFGLIGAFLNVYVKKTAGHRTLKVLITFFNMGCCGLMAASVVLYAVNKKIQVLPPLPTQIDFDLTWAIFFAAASVCMYFILFSLNIIDIAIINKTRPVDINEGSVAFSKNQNGSTNAAFHITD